MHDILVYLGILKANRKPNQKMKTRFVRFSCLLLLGRSYVQEVKNDKAKKMVAYIAAFIGAGGHGHAYPGATSPFGRVLPSPDNGTAVWDWRSGYHPGISGISGLAQVHSSDTGNGDLADVLLLPTNTNIPLVPTPNKTGT